MTEDIDADDGDDERRQAELELVEAAFTTEEAWCEPNHNTDDEAVNFPVVHRQLILENGGDNEDNNTIMNSNESSKLQHPIPVLLSLQMVRGYPETEPLRISVQLRNQQRAAASRKEETVGSSAPQAAMSCSLVSPLVKIFYDEGLSSLVSHCRDVASEMQGSESIFPVLSAADEWVQESWPSLVQSYMLKQQQDSRNQNKNQCENYRMNTINSLVLGRRLIYSHHIISKQKRKELQELADFYQLSGYVKIGWPGLIIIEGLEDHCNQFYDDIRKWAWQYLVVRGEMQEPIQNENGCSNMMERLNSQRCFHGFQEVSDMSVVATACREADLEALFKTSMKVYDNDHDQSRNNPALGDSKAAEQQKYFGALIHVDHMNNPKQYRKWLAKTSTELGTLLIVRDVLLGDATMQLSELHNNKKCHRPIILVVILGRDKSSVSLFLKRWRSCRVDVDSKGNPCLERKIQSLVEGPLSFPPTQKEGKGSDVGSDPWEILVLQHNQEKHQNSKRSNYDHAPFATTPKDMIELIASVASQEWSEIVEEFLSDKSSDLI